DVLGQEGVVHRHAAGPQVLRLVGTAAAAVRLGAPAEGLEIGRQPVGKGVLQAEEGGTADRLVAGRPGAEIERTFAYFRFRPTRHVSLATRARLAGALAEMKGHHVPAVGGEFVVVENGAGAADQSG